MIDFLPYCWGNTRQWFCLSAQDDSCPEDTVQRPWTLRGLETGLGWHKGGNPSQSMSLHAYSHWGPFPSPWLKHPWSGPVCERQTLKDLWTHYVRVWPEVGAYRTEATFMRICFCRLHVPCLKFLARWDTINFKQNRYKCWVAWLDTVRLSTL